MEIKKASLEDLIKDLQKSIECYEEWMNDPYGKEKYKGSYVYAVIVLGYLEELKELRIVNKNISRELITRTDKLIEKHKITCELNVGLLENTKECIPKSKVKELLDEVESCKNIATSNPMISPVYIKELDYGIEVLEELLGE